MFANRVANPLQLAVDGVLSECGPISEGIKKYVDVFRKTADEVPPLRQAGAPFENDLVAIVRAYDPQHFGNEVIFLDQGGAEPVIAKMLRCLEDRLFKIAMLKQPHANAAPLPARGEHEEGRRTIRNRSERTDSVNRAYPSMQHGSCRVADR